MYTAIEALVYVENYLADMEPVQVADKVEVLKRESRLDTNRDAELMHRFVRMNLDDNEEIAVEEDDCSVKSINEQSKNVKERDNINKKQCDYKSEEEIGTHSRKMSTVSISSQSKQPKLLAKLINQELKKKRKRRKMRNRRNEEIYTDKDRAAAMSMGSKDIKQSLKVKRRQDRSKTLCIPEEAEPGNFIALGNRERRCGNLKLATEFYTKVFL